MWRVLVAMKQRDPTYRAFGPGYTYSTDKDGGRETTAREAQSQLGKTGAYGETDLAIALFGFACSPESQSALETAHLSSSSRARAHAAWLSCITAPG